MLRPSVSTADLTKLVDSVCTAAKGAEGGDVAQQGRTLDGLKALKKQQVTTKLLSDTQAGKRIRALSKHSNADIARAAGEVVAAWKDVVRREADAGPSSSSQMQRGGSQGLDTTTQGAQPSSRSDGGGGGAAGAKSEGGYRSEGGGASQLASQPSSSAATSTLRPAAGEVAAAAGAAFDAGSLPKAGDPVRDKCRLNLALALQMAVVEGSTSHAGAVAAVAAEVESEIFRAHGGVTAAYKAKFRNLHFNMKDDKNPDLRRKVLTGLISPAGLITLPPEDLASDAKREENAAIREKKLFHAAPSTQKQATTDQFQCGKCRQRKCTYYQMQTRSADEPMTTFVTCLNCNNRWKFC